MWHVYILKCADNSLYTGVTTNLEHRLREHNRKKGGAYTRTHLPIKLAYKESCRTRSKALKRESEIKGLTRKKKLKLINLKYGTSLS